MQLLRRLHRLGVQQGQLRVVGGVADLVVLDDGLRGRGHRRGRILAATQPTQSQGQAAKNTSAAVALQSSSGRRLSRRKRSRAQTSSTGGSRMA